MSDDVLRNNASRPDASRPDSKEEQEIERLLADTLDLTPSTEADDAPPITVSEGCKHCGLPTHRICGTCHGAFCDQHSSMLDPAFCIVCLNEPQAEIKVTEGITDAEGVKHQGRDLQPTGEVFGTMCKRISEMSEYQLRAHVDYYKDLVRQAERTLDFRRTILGATQIELNQREDAIRRHFPKGKVKKSVTISLPGSSGTNGETKSQKRERKDSTTMLADALNLSKDGASAFMQAFSTLLSMAPSKPKESKK